MIAVRKPGRSHIWNSTIRPTAGAAWPALAKPTTRGAAARARPRVSMIPSGTAMITTKNAETKVSFTCCQICCPIFPQASALSSTESRSAVACQSR